jgi:hypothetical protein
MTMGGWWAVLLLRCRHVEFRYMGSQHLCFPFMLQLCQDIFANTIFVELRLD